jgi:hypothetical protein
VRVEYLSWSPLGREILFLLEYYSDGDGNLPSVEHRPIYSVNIDGSDLTRLTDDSLICDTPFWTPDGEQIVYVSARERCTPPDGGVYACATVHRELIIMDADGRNPQRIWGFVDVIDQTVHPWDRGRFPSENALFVVDVPR